MSNLLLNSLLGDTLGVNRGRVAIAMPDATYTLGVTEYVCETIEFTGTGVMTGTHDAIFPVNDGVFKCIDNQADHSVVCKVTGQTGVTIAAGKSAIIRGTATDYKRVTADA